jgi:DNA-binding NarL/FixJ family response regulator
LMLRGWTLDEIAEDQGLSRLTIRNKALSLYAYFGVKSRDAMLLRIMEPYMPPVLKSLGHANGPRLKRSA